jgi:hypothetical protein
METVYLYRIQLMRPPYSNRFRQEGIHASHPRKGITLHISVEMNHLFKRMNACIRTPRALSTGLRQRKLTQRRFQAVLHSPPVGLRLPTVPRRTIVLDAQNNPLQFTLSISIAGVREDEKNGRNILLRPRLMNREESSQFGQ